MVRTADMCCPGTGVIASRWWVNPVLFYLIKFSFIHSGCPSPLSPPLSTAEMWNGEPFRDSLVWLNSENSSDAEMEMDGEQGAQDIFTYSLVLSSTGGWTQGLKCVRQSAQWLLFSKGTEKSLGLEPSPSSCSWVESLSWCGFLCALTDTVPGSFWPGIVHNTQEAICTWTPQYLLLQVRGHFCLVWLDRQHCNVVD